MKQTNLFRLCGFLFTVLCISIFLFNSCKKDDAEQVDQYEPNNSITEASPITFNTEIKAWLTNQNDIDFYKFSGTASGKLDLLKFVLTNNSPDANFTITIYNKNKEEIAQVPYAGNGVDLNYQMSTKDAEFYVRVSGKDASSYPANYILKVSFANVADKYESNDDIATASLFPLNKMEECNLLSGDIDFYKIQDLSKENVWDAYEVKLVNKTTDMSPAISFYDASKAEIEGSELIAGPGKDITKQFFMKSGAGNAQYLKVYTLSPLVTIPANYTLEVIKKNLNEISEPNDTYSTAQGITTDGAYQGTCIKKVSGSNPADYDIDFVKVTIPAGKRLRYRITGENIKYDEYYSYSSSGAPTSWGSDESPGNWWSTISFGGAAYYYFAFKGTVDLAQWKIEIEIID